MIARPDGRDDQLRRVYRSHARAVFAFFGYSVPHEIAEDLTSSTFERVIKAWHRFDPSRASERTWILTIARNLLTDHYRRQQHRATVSTDEHPAIIDSLASAEDPLARQLTREGIVHWLELLGPREREVLAMRFGADLPAKDVAASLELTEANVHQITSRALRRLREHAADQVSDSAGPAS